VPVEDVLHIDITWFSVTNVHFRIGELGVLIDGYVSRIARDVFSGGGGGYAYSSRPFTPDVETVESVLEALGGRSAVSVLMSGHSHWDHSFDTAVWARRTGAPVIGSRSTVYQVVAQGIDPERCTTVVGGELIALPGAPVTVRVVRWNHSGDPAVNPEQHDPVELDAPPTPDPVTGGLRPGVAEDFPNGGGNRAYLFVAERDGVRLSWFFQNSASPVDLHVPIIVDGVDYGAPIENLKAAMQEAGLESVDLWIGTGGLPIARLVAPVIKPRAYLPVHWDSFWTPFNEGVAAPFADRELEPWLEGAGIALVRPRQYMDKWRLDHAGMTALNNDAARQSLGLPPG
jgi:L-ascorbate metabolism protein UlaG (beta-lactamase superfamily)